MTSAFRSAFLLSVSLGGLLGATALLHEAGPAPALAAESASKPAEAAPMPPEATALCKDGSWSSADSKQGACSSHGGIKTWFGKPPTREASFAATVSDAGVILAVVEALALVSE